MLRCAKARSIPGYLPYLALTGEAERLHSESDTSPRIPSRFGTSGHWSAVGRRALLFATCKRGSVVECSAPWSFSSTSRAGVRADCSETNGLKALRSTNSFVTSACDQKKHESSEGGGEWDVKVSSTLVSIHCL